MYIEPASRGPARVWHHEEPDFAALAVWTEQNPGHGEDADPLMLFRRPSGRGLIGVFDGVGGAGRTPAGRSPSGVDRTQAWAAGRLARGLAEEWFVASRGGSLGEHLATRMAELPAPESRMRGSIHRTFPTTIAALDFQRDAGEVHWEVLWAGDSRCYVAEPNTGLQQLSRDDTDLADILQQLVQDPPLNNMVSASRQFALNRWRGRAYLPCLLVCATDGCFGYVQTPAEFEHVLLSTMLSAQDLVHWSGLLTERISSYTGDDASLVLVSLGLNGFDDLRRHYRERAEEVRREHGAPMALVRPGDRAELVAARERSWHRYRSTYERRLLGADGATG